jgi:transcriptional accessory protein Tex/SPT6
MPEAKNPDFSRVAQDLQIRRVQVESVVQLLDEGNTVPFITRFRKEKTGGLNEETIRLIQSRVRALRQLADRKQTILKSIESQGKLTDELRAAITAAESSRRLDDLYLPFKPKKRSPATTARERGLEPLALAIWNRDPAVANLEEVLPTLVNPDQSLATPEEVKLGVQQILAELIADSADVRAAVRSVLWDTGKLVVSKSDKLPEGQGIDYKDYFQFTEPARRIPPHRIMAINRGEKTRTLKVKLEWDAALVRQAAGAKVPLTDHPHGEFLQGILDDALVRLLLPALEREVRRELTEEAEAHAVKVFARNLRSLLLQRPLHDRRVLAVDPGFRTGCKIAVLDQGGNLIEDAVIFPHQPQNKKNESLLSLEKLVRRHQVHLIAIGNGTACRETEELVSELLAGFERRRRGETVVHSVTQAIGTGVAVAAGAGTSLSVAIVSAFAPAVPIRQGSEVNGGSGSTAQLAQDLDGLPEPLAELSYVIVNEAGASVYSASVIGRDEFPDLDATLRGTISIGRRLQNPLSELVKIDPQSIGVGLYQHDVNPKLLKESLEAIVESSVNHVGIDLNAASAPLLRYVAGLNPLLARDVVEYRKQHGPFRNRQQLREVPSVGESRWVQAAGFVKIQGGDNPLDRTWVHPESYALAERLLGEVGHAPASLEDNGKSSEVRDKLKSLSPEEVATRLQVGTGTVRDIIEALSRPGHDPREDLSPPIFKKGILRLEDLQPGMELKGTVLNVVDFGAFVDIGLKDSGLVHISQMASRYIKNPYDVVSVGDTVTTWVLAVDHGRRRVSLTMITPGTERKPPEKREPRPKRSEHPAAGERPRRNDRPARGKRPPRPAAAAPSSNAVSSETTPPAATAAAAPMAPEPTASAARQPAPAPPRKPKRVLPKPKLSEAALQRKAPLRSFSELEVFFEAKDKEQPPES